MLTYENLKKENLIVLERMAEKSIDNIYFWSWKFQKNKF